MSGDEAARRRGRPPKPLGDAARGPLTIRLRAEVRTEVERSAVRYGRSLSEEIESRLEVSLANKHYIRHELGEDIFIIAQAMAASLSHIEDWTGKAWTTDPQTFEAFQATVSNIVQNYRDLSNKASGRSWPSGGFEGKTTEELGQMFAALGGLSPPRTRKPAAPAEPSDEQREARARGMANMRAILADDAGGVEPDA